MIGVVKELEIKGHFDVFADKLPQPMIDEMPMEKAVGIETMFDEVWKCVEDHRVGIIGLYGMGGVGKTTLLKKLNNKFLTTSHNFDVVIWVVVSKEVKLEKIQETIRNKLQISDEIWKKKNEDERAAEILRRLRNRRFVLFLDDLWHRLDLSKVGVPISDNENEFKVVFTTRSGEVCGLMEAKMKFKLNGLSQEAALSLFRQKVGEDVLNSHHEIPQLAEVVAEECNGLPLALVTIGRAMASRTKPEDWRYAIKVLKSYPSRFPEMGKYVFPSLRFSYDSLSDNTLKTCFLYCSIFPEDHNISNKELVELWIGEGFLNDFDNVYEAKEKGRYIIESLKLACLLEESCGEGRSYENDHVMMHDVLRDMTLWIASEFGNEILVREHTGLIKSQEIVRWKEAVRVSLHGDNTRFPVETPVIFPHVRTIFVMGTELTTLPGTLFQSMLNLGVLNLSNNKELTELPIELGALINLHYLNLSTTCLRQLPIEVKNLTQLRILLLDEMSNDVAIPEGVISSLSSLEMYSNFEYWEGKVDMKLIGELECLEKITDIGLTFSNADSVLKLMSSPMLQCCITRLSILKCEELHSLDISSSTMRRMEHLEYLNVRDCPLREVKMWLENGERMQRSESNCFRNLQILNIFRCAMENLTWFIYIPQLRFLYVTECESLEEIIASDFVSGCSEIEEDVEIFPNIKKIYFRDLPKLKSICRRAMPFSSLQDVTIYGCPSLKKLPFSAQSAKNLKAIQGYRRWWHQLEWEDEATMHAFTSKFQTSEIDLARILICYNGQWEEVAGCGYQYVRFRTKGVRVARNTTYEQLVMIVRSKVDYDSGRYDIVLKALIRGQEVTCMQDLDNDDEVDFVLSDENNLPKICVSLVERTGGDRPRNIDVVRNQIRSLSGSNQPVNEPPTVPTSNRQSSEHIPWQRITNEDPPLQTNHNSSIPRWEPNVESLQQYADPPDLPFANVDTLERNDAQQDGRSDVQQDARMDPQHDACKEDEPDGVAEETARRNCPSSSAPTEWIILGAESYAFHEVTDDLSMTPTSLVYKGQFFSSKKDLKRALGIYAIRQNFEYRVKRSDRSTFHAICKVDNCVWKCRAVRRSAGMFFEIQGFVDQHTCPLEEVHHRHRQAGYTTIGEIIAPRLQNGKGRIIKPKDIQGDMKEMFGIQILYSKAYKALQYTLLLAYGDAKESYRLLPAYCHVLKQHNPGTITQYRVDFLRRFEYFFMALGQSLTGFRTCMRPIIAIDGTHLKGKFKGTMFVAAAKDGNEQIYPLAIGYGDSENNMSWEWFLQSLRDAIGHINDLVFVSDRHQSIERGVRTIFPEAVHCYCRWYLCENLKKTYHRADVAKIFVDAANAFTRYEFNVEMAELYRVSPKCHDFLMLELGPHKWSRVYCPRRRYFMMTSNIAESINVCLRLARMLPVTTLAEFIRNVIQRWFFDRRTKAESGRSQLTSAAHERIKEWSNDSNSMTATHVDWHVFEVKYRADRWTVDLRKRTCTCKVFDMTLLPCAHALAAIREQNLDLTSFIADYYKKNTLVQAYSQPIYPVGVPQQWEVPNNLLMEVVLPPLVKPQTGRPQNSRMRSATKSSRSQRRTRCRTQGHNSWNYPNPVPIEATDQSGSHPLEARPRQRRRKKCSTCGKEGHNHITCPRQADKPSVPQSDGVGQWPSVPIDEDVYRPSLPSDDDAGDDEDDDSSATSDED